VAVWLLVSVAAAVVLLWLASLRLTLWPAAWQLHAPADLALAVALQVPYAATRALRLQYLLDPLVSRATAEPNRTFDRRALYGSGWVSFFVLLVLPLKLGELSRPLLLQRARQPGVALTEAVAAVGAERLVDGLLISAMLLLGLQWSTPQLPVEVDVHALGGSAAFAFGLGVLVLIGLGRSPESWALALTGPLARARASWADRSAQILVRIGHTMQSLLVARQGIPLLGWSLVYWALTVAQTWLVMRACGLSLGFGEATVCVAIVGLSIQLPGGPAQAGTFQVGAAVGLGLYLDAAGLQAGGSQFAFIMYLLGLFGAAAMAIPGLWILRASVPR